MEAVSVSYLNKYIKKLFESDEKLEALFVRGELSNFKWHSSGHTYFTLKDAYASIRCVMFKGRAQYLKFEPKDGLKVVAYGQVTVFERDGQYQLYVEYLIPDGVGEIGAMFEQLKEKLAAEGLFDQDRKKKLPVLPKAVGIITSPTGAAVRDIFTVAKRRYKNLPLILCPVQVQGPEAPSQIAQAVRNFNRLKEADVLIVGRGGGSVEELWAFNDEQVVRAVAASEIPVISAVGHETDYTLSDFAADCRAATPSQAAELAVPDVQELLRHLKNLAGSLKISISSQLKVKRNLVENLRASHVFVRPDKLLAPKSQELDFLMERLKNAAKTSAERKYQFLKLATARLNMLNPLEVLSRGYSVVRSADGKIIRLAIDTAPGQNIEIILKKGRIEAQVIKVLGGNGIGKDS